MDAKNGNKHTQAITQLLLTEMVCRVLKHCLRFIEMNSVLFFLS
jgi:hypothetical protein